MNGWDTSAFGGVVAVLFAIPLHLMSWRYARLPWWRTDLGRGLFMAKSGLAVLVDLALVRMVWDYTNPPLETLRLLAALWTLAGFWMQWKAWTVLVTKGRRSKHATHRGTPDV